jgi:NADPH:quinone reductase
MSTPSLPATQRRLISTITASGQLRLQLETVPVPTPADHEVLIRVDAAPINPSDLFLLTGPADLSTLRSEGDRNNPVAIMDVPPHLLKTLSARLDKPMPVGNEGSGVVVAAGKKAQALLGKLVGVAAGDMFCQYRCAPATHCIVMNEGTTAQQAASCFVNPLTSLSMVETMRMENHKALVHTAAASNLGQMLVRICKADGVPLVNVVRNDKQVNILRELGAEFICNSSAPTFKQDLLEAVSATGATLAFDAIGGGQLASQILTAMEIAINRTATEYSRYGSSVHKQVYIYGGLDMNPIMLNRTVGFAWGVGGWLLTPFIGRMGPERFLQLRKRVADEITTTFASHYTQELSLADALGAAAIQGYTRQATGEKYLILPQR